MAGTARSLGATILLSAALSGCAASESAVVESGSRGADANLRSRVQTDRRMGRMGSSDDAKCQAYGFQPGTGGYADCRARLRQESARERTPAR